MMNISRILKLWWLILPALLVSAGLGQAGEQTKPRLAILPFTLNGSDDLAYLKEGVRAMLASRIAVRAGVIVLGGAEVARVVAGKAQPDLQGVADELAADLVLAGSITALGPGVSIDARLLMVDRAVSENFFAAAENKAQLIDAIDQLASEVSAVISGEEREAGPLEKSPAEATSSSEPALSAEEDGSPHPDRIFEKSGSAPVPLEVPEGVSVPAPARSMPIAGSANGRSDAAEPTLAGTHSRFLDMEIQAIDVGDLFGEGAELTVVAEKQEISVFRRDNKQLTKVAEAPEAPRHVRIIALNLADLNNNGRAEIYITAVSAGAPYSYAMEWNGRGFAKLFDRQRHYLRPLFLPGKGWGLYGQRSGIDNPVKPGIYKADPRTGALDTADRLAVPDSVNLYEFVMADFTGDGRLETAVQTQENQLLVYSDSGDVLWRGSADYGYTRRFIGEPYAGGDQKILQVPTRLIASDLNGDGRPELAAMENPAGVASLVKTVSGFVGSSIKVMTWNGVTFAELWSTAEIGSYVAGFQVEGDRLYLGLVTKKSGGLFKSFDSAVASYSLTGLGAGNP